MRRLRSAALWALFTVMAVVSGLGAVGVVQNAIAGSAPAPLSQSQVSAELRTAGTGPTVSPSPSPSPTESTSKPKPKPKPTKSAKGSTGAQPSAGAGSSGTGPSAASTPTAQPTKSATPKPSQGSGSGSGSGVQTRVLTSRGGSVVASCSSGQVYLRSWSPAAGYIVDEVHRGPAEAAEIKFRSSGGHDDEVSLRVTCRAGTPTSSSDGSSDHRD